MERGLDYTVSQAPHSVRWYPRPYNRPVTGFLNSDLGYGTVSALTSLLPFCANGQRLPYQSF